MQDMYQLAKMGLIDDDYMKDLKKTMDHEQSLKSFADHLEKASGRPDTSYRGSGGNGKRLVASQRRSARKAQKKARKKARKALS